MKSQLKLSVEKMIVGALVIIAIGFFGGCNAAYQLLTVENYNVTVEGKERIMTGSGDSISHKYLIYTDSKVFENTDALFHWKWDSSDLQNKLKKGKTYEVKTYGWRIPLLSTYENIVSAEEVAANNLQEVH